MKVVLVNPPPRKVVEVRYDTPDYPHIGLGYIAGYLESKGVDVEVIDAKLARLSFDDMVNQICKLNPQIVGLTAMTHEIQQSADAAKEIKRKLPDIIICIGGVHATALPRETLEEFQVFDVVFHGEGEISFYDFISAVRDRHDLKSVKGIAFRASDNIIVNPQQNRLIELDLLPFPAWHKFPKAKEYLIMTGRGCPFSCNFCMRPNGTKVRKRSPENVVAEIEKIVKDYKPAQLLFCDETFTIDKKNAHRIMDLMIERGLSEKVKWYVQTHVNTVDEHILEKMRRAGCFSIGFGVESGNPAILKQTKKGITMDAARRAVQLAKKMDIFAECYFIIGHPNETYNTIRDTINFASELNPDRPIFGIMVPYPGTEVWEMAKKGEGGYKVLSAKWSDFNKQIGNALEFQNISRKKLELMQMAGYVWVFLKNFRLRDLTKFIFQYRHEGWAVVKKLCGVPS